MNEEQSSKKKLWIILAITLIVILLCGLYYFFVMRPKTATDTASRPSFGNVTDITQPSTNGGEGVPTTPLPDGESTGANNENEPLFRQLANIPVAGAVAILRDGKPYVRYVARENGHVFEVDPETGASTELTNTTIPRIYEALWATGGNSVVLRYLTQDPLSRKDVIKTYLARLALPISGGSTTPSLGSLKGSFLPDNLTEVSISPNGTQLFYLLPVADGVSGTIVTLANMAAKEVLRNSFSEWLPQLLNDGTIILTTKPSSEVHGFSYLYNPKDKTLTRLIREKNALTTLGESRGTRVLYSENVLGNTTLGLYDKKGFNLDEGLIGHESTIPLATLAEKCVWSKNRTHLYCGAFTSTPRNAAIPDDWYQGTQSFVDTFWLINTNSSEITFLADPQKSIQQKFDVKNPFMGTDEAYLYFTNKKDSTLWSLRVQKQITTVVANTAKTLTPEELKDAEGSSVPAKTSSGTKK